MNKEFIPYEEARLLKGLGFNEPCLRYYWEGATELMGNNTSPKTNWELTDLSNSDLKGLEGTVFMTAPLYQQAFRWFREKYILGHMINGIGYESFIMNIGGMLHIFNPFDFKTYEEAELACLKKLIEILNQNKEDE